LIFFNNFIKCISKYLYHLLRNAFVIRFLLFSANIFKVFIQLIFENYRIFCNVSLYRILFVVRWRVLVRFLYYLLELNFFNHIRFIEGSIFWRRRRVFFIFIVLRVSYWSIKWIIKRKIKIALDFWLLLLWSFDLIFVV
jgi:hypothetical protein